MAKVGNRQYKTLVCSECKEENYREPRNVRNTTERLEMNKYCPRCRKHTVRIDDGRRRCRKRYPQRCI